MQVTSIVAVVKAIELACCELSRLCVDPDLTVRDVLKM